MDNWTRLNIFALIFLSASLVTIGIQTHAISAPSIGNTQEPGSAAENCRFTFNIDGSTYLAKDGLAGGNPYTGTDFRPVFQNARTAGGAGKYCLGPGTFTVTKQTVNSEQVGLSLADNTYLQGSGIGITTVKIANTQFTGGTQAAAVIANENWNVGAASPDDNIIISDLTVDGNKANQVAPTTGQQMGIIFNPVRQGIIERVEVKNFYSWGIAIYSAETGAGLDDPVANIVSHNWLHDGGNGQSSANFDTGIFVSYHRKSNSIIDSNIIHDVNGYGIALEDAPDGVIMSNNIIYKNQGDGIRLFLAATGFKTNSTRIIGNTIYLNGGISAQGAGILADAAGTGLIISQNNIFRNNRQGILVQARYEHAIGTIISNNLCYENSKLSPNPNLAGIQILGNSATEQLQKPIITGNICFDNQSTKTQARGFEEGGQVANGILTNNQFGGNVNASSLNGANWDVIRNNGGYVTENWGEVTGIVCDSTGVKTSVVAHGLAGTPDSIQITVNDVSDEASRFTAPWSDTVGATNFTFNIAITTAGAAGCTLQFMWYAVFIP